MLEEDDDEVEPEINRFGVVEATIMRHMEELMASEVDFEEQ